MKSSRLSKLSKQDITEIIFRMAIRDWRTDAPVRCMHRRINILHRLNNAHRLAHYDGPMLSLVKAFLYEVARNRKLNGLL